MRGNASRYTGKPKLQDDAMSNQESRFAELGNIIQNRTKEIQQFLSSQGLPSPSLAADAGADLPLPHALQGSRDEILQACTELQALAEGPRMHLTRLTSPTVSKPQQAQVIVADRWQMNIMMSIQAIYRYKIASELSLNERVSFNELAKRCNIDEQDLTRLMRLAIANHIFIEPQKGFIEHSAMSKLLATDPLLHSWIGLVCEEMWPPQQRVVEAMQKWPGSEEPQHTAYCLANPGMTSYFQAMESSPERNRRFAEGMRYLQSAPAFAIEHLFNDLGWDAAQTPKVMVDIGGSLGSIATQLLRRFPALKCEVQDLAETVAEAQVPDDLEGRLEFRAHNFFTEQPRRDADVYFMRSILHDWSDKYALQILRGIVPALKDGATVIINEVCLPEPNRLPFYHAQLLL
jgi:hypothetical protein